MPDCESDKIESLSQADALVLSEYARLQQEIMKVDARLEELKAQGEEHDNLQRDLENAYHTIWLQEREKEMLDKHISNLKNLEACLWIIREERALRQYLADSDAQ